MWWIIGGVILLLFVFIYLFMRGADLKNRNEKYKAELDDEQKKIVSKMSRENYR